MTDQDEVPKKVDPIAKGAGIGCLGVIAVVAALFIAGAVMGSGDDGTGHVKVACHDWVKDRLKSPASAKFSGDMVEHDGSTYTVTGSVDSQNGFGAMIRTHYTCVARHDGDSTTLVSLDGLAG